MTRVLYIIFAIVIFGVLVGIHELGHFIAAKLCGVRVEEFAIGMGPAIFKRRRGETLYALRIIPLGGYCAMAGEDEASDDERAFTNQAPWKRAIILVAGAFMNFVLGFALILGVFSDAKVYPAPKFVDFLEGCPYNAEYGFQKDDMVIKIDGRYVFTNEDLIAQIKRKDTHDIVLERGGELIRLDDYRMVPVKYPGQENKVYGFTVSGDLAKATFGSYLAYSWDTAKFYVEVVWDSIVQLFTGGVSVNDLSGPVGIVDIIADTGESAETTQDAILNILSLASFIAINLAIMNLLPIPALDGGRVFALLITAIIEAFTRKKLDPKYEGYVHAAGMALLIGLMAFVMFNDIVRIVK